MILQTGEQGANAFNRAIVEYVLLESIKYSLPKYRSMTDNGIGRLYVESAIIKEALDFINVLGGLE